jgi:hypothetical protein
MALTRVIYTQSVEGNTTFTVPFPYLDADDVKVTVDGEPTTVTWNNSSVLSISPAPIVGAIVYIQRRTNSNALLVDFTDGSTLSEKQLDLMAQQNFYLAQEAFDRTEDSIADNGKFQLDAKNRRIINVANPVEGGHAVNKRTLQYEYPMVEKVAESIGNVNVVGGDLSNVSLYQMDLGSITEAPTVKTEGATSAIRAVAEIKQAVQTVALNAAQVRNVGDNITSVAGVAGSVEAINEVNNNLPEILTVVNAVDTVTANANAAQISAATATTKAALAHEWAEKMGGTVDGSGYSAKYWAGQAQNYVGGVTSFNTRTGAVTLSGSDVTSALGYTPFNSANFSTLWGSQTENVTSSHLATSLDLGTLT